MTPIVFLAAVVVGSALDPIMWIGPIVGAFKSRSWKLPLALGAAGAVLEIMIVAAISERPFDGAMAAGRVVAGIVFGLIVFGVAKLIRRGKPAATAS